jgi:hypothetical protein
LRRNTARFRAVSHRKRPHTAKLRLKICLSVIIGPGYSISLLLSSAFFHWLKIKIKNRGHIEYERLCLSQMLSHAAFVYERER